MSLVKNDTNNDVQAPVVVKSSCCGGSLEEHHHQAVRRSESSLDVLGDAVDRLTVKIERLIAILDNITTNPLTQVH